MGLATRQTNDDVSIRDLNGNGRLDPVPYNSENPLFPFRYGLTYTEDA